MQIAEGHTIDIPDKVHKVLDERTDKTWPTTFFVPLLTVAGSFSFFSSFLSPFFLNHGAISYG
ncbi:L-fucose isomerase, partial [Sphingobacterium daejeonense]